ncbi:MAG TPA: hypothetical protein VFS44_14325 [Gemmatimonadaceae bacterium]|nr:hypothetical protein [Gemmatimonadaceae bacterium]
MAGFGAYHGLNPAMGWLFALALGLQQRSTRAIWLALPFIALGHAVALVLVASAVLALGAVLPFAVVDVIAALALLGFGAWKLRRYYRHPRWVGMRVGARDLVAWSFLMAVGHGAGLMVAPVLVVIAGPAPGVPVGATARALGLAVAVHTAAMLVVMALVAWVVYRKVGLAVLRRGWVNFDLIWAAALLVVGVLALGRGIWEIHQGA